MPEFQGCPGSRVFDFRRPESTMAVEGAPGAAATAVQSQLRQWPIQLHLVMPTAPYYQGADVLLAADCTAYALGPFQDQFLKGKALAIACPKLDQGQDVYVQKIKAWFDDAKINTLTVLIMQVPCCMGLANLALQAAKQASRAVPIKCVVVSLQGQVLKEEWLSA